MVILTIPTVPPSPNVLRRKYKNPHAYKKLRERFEHDLFYCWAGAWRRKLLMDQVRTASKMWVEMTLYHPRLYDADNLVGSLKPVLDAMVNIGFLVNDSPERLNLLPTKQFQVRKEKVCLMVKIGVVD